MSYLERKSNKIDNEHLRIRLFALGFTFVGFVILCRLMMLMVFQHQFYTALAAGSQEIYAKLFPKRGEIFLQDSRTKEEFPIAINRDYFLVYADTRKFETDDDVETVAEGLSEILEYNDEQKLELFLKINKRDDPYEPIEKKIDEALKNKIEEKDFKGIGFVRTSHRYYPEEELAAQTIGFVGKNEEGQNVGRYGIEGYWQKELGGSGGFFEGAKSASGGWIPLAGKSFSPSEDGADLLLTLDRTLQFKACEQLEKSRIEYEAQSASLIIMNPKNGAILSMCSLPAFSPNRYNEVASVNNFNNTNIFTPYEPGSIFKPIAMAAALNEELITPSTYFYDTGVSQEHCDTPIKNAAEQVFKEQTMVGVLENSINTGMVNVVERLGKNRFRDYIEKFGFGTKEGIELDTEVSGTVESLYRNKKDKVDCYTATASFGQGITATPLQMVTAFGAIANGGTMMKPFIVEEVRYKNGKLEKIQPTIIREVISKRASSLVGGMMVSVIDSGQAGSAAVEGYYIAGKTGTAQIADRGGYSEETNHSFIGFGPVDDPKFVMIIKFEKPQRRFSVSTAAPTFGKIAKFILDYYQVPPGR